MTPREATQAHRFSARAEALPTSRRDPNMWLAMYLDTSLPMNAEAKAALVLDAQTASRQFLLPAVRVLARAFIVLFQLLKVFLPRKWSASRFLHWLIYWGLKNFVTPEANFLILRHFHIGTEVLAFLRANTRWELPTEPLRPRTPADVKKEIFLQHDINLFNFVIDLSQHLRAEGTTLGRKEKLDLSPISDGPFPIDEFPRRWTHFIDLSTAIELYTPLYQLFLSDTDFWRASNSLQLDETVALYVSSLVGESTHLALVNNKHPLVPLSTLRAGYRLVLHGLAAEGLHALLVRAKRAAAAEGAANVSLLGGSASSG